MYEVLGYKGQTEIDAATFYCPYIPGQSVDELEEFWAAVERRLRDNYRREQLRLTDLYRHRNR